MTARRALAVLVVAPFAGTLLVVGFTLVGLRVEAWAQQRNRAVAG